MPKVRMLEGGRAGVGGVYQYRVTVSHRAHVIPHRHICTFCVLPPQRGFCPEGSLTVCSAVRGMGWQVAPHQGGERGKPRFSPEGRRQKVPEAFSFPAALSQFCHMNRNLFIAIRLQTRAIQRRMFSKFQGKTSPW